MVSTSSTAGEIPTSSTQQVRVRVILGSASPARLKTLQNAGVFPEVIVSDVDERAAVAAAEAEHGPLTPAEHALLLARAKAEAVANSLVVSTAAAPSAAAQPTRKDAPHFGSDGFETPLRGSSTDGLVVSTAAAPSAAAQPTRKDAPRLADGPAPSSFCASGAQTQNLTSTRDLEPPSRRLRSDVRSVSKPSGQPRSGDKADVVIVIGCDSVFEFEGKPYGRPPSAEAAFERIKSMSGNSGTLHTGHWVIVLESGRDSASSLRSAQNDGRAHSAQNGEGVSGRLSSDEGAAVETPRTAMQSYGMGAIGSSIVHFGVMDDDEIAAYVATGEPLNVAGSFTVDSLGGPYIESIEGDYHNVVGISLPLLRNLLRQLEIPWHALRTA